jgi:hypothetical protein
VKILLKGSLQAVIWNLEFTDPGMIQKSYKKKVADARVLEGIYVSIFHAITLLASSDNVHIYNWSQLWFEDMDTTTIWCFPVTVLAFVELEVRDMTDKFFIQVLS